jgi:hypothetical protein
MKLPLPAGFGNVTISEKDRRQLRKKHGVRAHEYEAVCPEHARAGDETELMAGGILDT